MLLQIDDWRTVGDLQYRFNKCFPNLELLLYDGVHRDELLPLHEATQLTHIRRNHEPGELAVKSWFTKMQVERLLAEGFGLRAEIVPVKGRHLPTELNAEKATLQQLNEQAVPVQQAEIQPTDEIEGMYL